MRRERKEEKEEIHEDSIGSDSVFADDLDTEDEVEEFETDSELEDGFDDDYSFCETSKRPVSRCERQPRFASFDSCDMSITEDPELGRTSSPRHLSRQMSVQDGVKTRKRLTKTYSEPRHAKQLPAWVEKGRSGFIPRRQLSAPAQPKQSPERPKLPLPVPASGSSSDSLTLTHHEKCLSQGTHKDLPPNDKRTRFSRQKTIHEPGLSGLLAPPAISMSGSCEHLAKTQEISLVPLQVILDPTSSQENVTIVQASRSSSQETLC